MQDTVLCQRYGTTANKATGDGCTMDQKIVAVQGLLCVPTPLILILIGPDISDILDLCFPFRLERCSTTFFYQWHTQL